MKIADICLWGGTVCVCTFAQVCYTVHAKEKKIINILLHFLLKKHLIVAWLNIYTLYS